MEGRSHKTKAESAYHERMVVGTDFAGDRRYVITAFQGAACW